MSSTWQATGNTGKEKERKLNIGGVFAKIGVEYHGVVT